MTVNPTRLAVGQMAKRLASGYPSVLVAHWVAVNPTAINLLQREMGEIPRKDGISHAINLRFHLDQLREDRGLQDHLLRSWAMGALLMLGDALKEHKYFDHAPILELVYHLRNGMAHGNQFSITKEGKKQLAKHEAHNRHAAVKSPLGTVYEIAPDLTGAILFDFIGAGDVIDLLESVGAYLSTNEQD